MIERTAKYIFNKHAIKYQEQFMQIDLFKKSLKLFSSEIRKSDAKILDIGCGPGNISQFLINQNQDYQIFGIDVAPKMIELAQINNPSARFKIMDCKDINQLNSSYDGIVSGFCLPYLSKPETVKFISQATALLNPNGVLYISTMEDDYDKSGLVGSSSGGEDVTNIYYYKAEFLTQLLIKNGFNIIDIQKQTHPHYKDNSTRDIIIIAQKPGL
jgi:2-polyprenyl-3-methyl-5-hydroxy-6-metoxy-1,4-benzoquinol methylase